MFRPRVRLKSAAIDATRALNPISLVAAAMSVARFSNATVHVDSPDVVYTDDTITAKYRYLTTDVSAQRQPALRPLVRAPPRAGPCARPG